MAGEWTAKEQIRRHGRTALVVLVVIVVSAVAIALRPPPPPPATPFPSVPAQACQLPASADKAGETHSFAWQRATETDRPEGSVILFVSGRDTLLCFVARSSAGMLAGSWTAIGTETGAGDRLTLDSGTVPSGADSPGTAQATILVGRVPPATATVRVAVGPEVEDVTAVGNGRYLAWLHVAGTPTRIEALDRAGTVLGRLENAQGLPFGD